MWKVSTESFFHVFEPEPFFRARDQQCDRWTPVVSPGWLSDAEVRVRGAFWRPATLTTGSQALQPGLVFSYRFHRRPVLSAVTVGVGHFYIYHGVSYVDLESAVERLHVCCTPIGP